MKAKQIKEILKEWGGAGFSMSRSSMFSVNRGGFSGGSNLGGPNMMYTYEIKPLNRTLQPKPSDFTDVPEIKPGNVISGEELNKKDGKIHTGVILKIAGEENIDYYVILDDKTGTIIKIDPTSANLESGVIDVDKKNVLPGPDDADLKRSQQTANEK